MSALLTPDDFLPHVGKAFRIAGGPQTLTLTRIDRRRREDWESEAGLREPFNLIFRGPPGEVLPAGMQVLEVEDGPAFELYIMPVHTPARDRQDYQAAFN